MSTKTDEPATTPDIGARIAARVRELRTDQGCSLDALAARSGVSRSAISAIERGTASPTAVVLEKLATGLGVALPSLFDTPGDGHQTAAPPGPLARRADQPVWSDPQSGYRRRQLSPPGWPSPVRLVEVELPAGATVAFDNGTGDITVHQQVWVLSGRLDVTVGDTTHALGAGDCLAMRLDHPTAFHNPARRGDTRYATAVVTDGHAPRRTR